MKTRDTSSCSPTGSPLARPQLRDSVPEDPTPQLPSRLTGPSSTGMPRIRLRTGCMPTSDQTQAQFSRMPTAARIVRDESYRNSQREVHTIENTPVFLCDRLGRWRRDRNDRRVGGRGRCGGRGDGGRRFAGDRGVDLASEGVTVGADESRQRKRYRACIEGWQRCYRLGVASGSVNRAGEFAPGPRGVDRRHGHRLERHARSNCEVISVGAIVSVAPSAGLLPSRVLSPDALPAGRPIRSPRSLRRRARPGRDDGAGREA